MDREVFARDTPPTRRKGRYGAEYYEPGFHEDPCYGMAERTYSHTGSPQDRLDRTMYRNTYHDRPNAGEVSERNHDRVPSSFSYHEQAIQDREVRKTMLEAEIQALEAETERLRIETRRHRSTVPEADVSQNSGKKALSKLLPSKFDGKSEWESYLLKFNFIARAQSWDETDKVYAMVNQLEGDALQVFQQMSVTEQLNFDCICQAMNNQFAPVDDIGLYMNLLNQKQQGKDESIEGLARDICKLAKRAYPASDRATFESVSVNHFINALTDAKIRVKLRENFPNSLDEAMKRARELQAIERIENERQTVRKSSIGVHHVTNPVLSVSGETPSSDSDVYKLDRVDMSIGQRNVSIDEWNKMQKELKRVTEELESMKAKQQNSERRPRFRPKYTSRKDIECWNCKEKGHTQRYCRAGQTGNGYTHNQRYNPRMQYNQNEQPSMGNSAMQFQQYEPYVSENTLSGQGNQVGQCQMTGTQ